MGSRLAHTPGHTSTLFYSAAVEDSPPGVASSPKAKPRLTRQSRVVAEGRSEGITPRATTRRFHHCSATLCIRRQAMLVGPPRPQEAC